MVGSLPGGSLPFDEKKGCDAGYHKRESYTSKLGYRVPPRCVRSTVNYTHRVRSKQSARLRAIGKSRKSNSLKCPPGKIERNGYVRKFSRDIRQKGYTVKRSSGKIYRVYPKHDSVYVKPGCIKDRGLKGKLAPGEGFGILHKGDLKKYGYIYSKSEDARHDAIKKAIKEYGALGVFRKLDAVSKLSKRTAPHVSKIFTKDRDWIRSHYKGFLE